MLLKQQALISHLKQKPLSSLYILIGQDHYLLNNAANNIKLTWREQGVDNSCDETILYINESKDWSEVTAAANSYSLFANTTLIDVRFDKKALDSSAKEFLASYSKDPNPRCLILLRSPNLTMKQLQWIVPQNTVQLLQLFPLQGIAMQNWIREQLQQQNLNFDSQIPELIHRYTLGNMLASAQAVEKLKLLFDDKTTISINMAKEQLFDQCEYTVFELSDACLAGNAQKLMKHIRYASQNHTEPTLILWILTQDLRQLIQLIQLTQQNMSFNTACNQLKIWPKKVPLYQLALKRSNLTILLQLLRYSATIDARIKSNQTRNNWQSLELLALSLCLGKLVSHLD
jgi:DNA polymerase-3 subunit delta